MTVMKKKFLTLFLALLLLTSCASGEGGAAETGDGVSESVENTVKTVTGTANLTWHVDTTFVAAVDVTVEDGVITDLVLRDASVVTTDAFTGWIKGRESYLEQYIGKTVEQIKALVAEQPVDVYNHYDGGSMSGDIDAIAGATASSTVVAMAVKNAIEKLEG